MNIPTASGAAQPDAGNAPTDGTPASHAPAPPAGTSTAPAGTASPGAASPGAASPGAASPGAASPDAASADAGTADAASPGAVQPGAVPAGAPTTGAGTAGADWRRLSRRMLAVHPVQEALRVLPALLAALVAGSSSGHSELWTLPVVAAAVGLGLLRWATTTYRVSADQVQVRRGFLRRRVLSIPRDRVRTVDLTAHPLHRALGLARITVGTGQSGRKEGLRLDGLTAAEAVRLRAELLHRVPATTPPAPAPSRDTAPSDPASPDSAPPSTAHPNAAYPSTAHPNAAYPNAAHPSTAHPSAADETVLATLRPGWVRYGPFTLSGLVTIGIVFGFVYRLANEAHVDPGRFGPLRAVTHQLARVPLGVAVVEVVLAAIVLVSAASTLGYLLAFWSFRLTRQHSGTLHVNRGLITTRATTLEERRLRGVELSEPLLLRAVRGARCIAIATGLRVGRGAERGGSLLLPPAPVTEARRVAAEVLGDAAPMTVALRRHGPGARRRRYTRALVLGAILPAGLALLWWLADWPAWAPVVALLVLPAAGWLAADRYRSLGHTVTAGYLVVRQGSVVRRRCALTRDGIIGWHLRQSLFQRRLGLVTVIATTAAGRQRYALPDVGIDASVPLVDETTPDLLTPFLLR